MSKTNSNIKKCPDCNEKFGVFRWRYACTECRRTICDDCSHDENQSFLKRCICNKCLGNIQYEIGKIKVVKSPHIGGHNIVKKFNFTEGTHWLKNPQESVEQLKYEAYKKRANCILSLLINKETESESTDKNGTYHYSVFNATGVPAIVEEQNKPKPKYTPINFHGKKKPTEVKKDKKNIGSELEKLVKLKEQGHISQEEFKMAKEKLFN